MNNHITVLFIYKSYKMTFDDVSGHSYTLPAMTMARMNVSVLQIILVRFVLLTIDIYECDFSEFGTQYSCNVFPSQSRN
jgi:hypothetical protein